MSNIVIISKCVKTVNIVVIYKCVKMINILVIYYIYNKNLIVC